jgi:hypothetical protein
MRPRRVVSRAGQRSPAKQRRIKRLARKAAATAADAGW